MIRGGERKQRKNGLKEIDLSGTLEQGLRMNGRAPMMLTILWSVLSECSIISEDESCCVMRCMFCKTLFIISFSSDSDRRDSVERNSRRERSPKREYENK